MDNRSELEKRIATTNDAGLIAMLFERLIANCNNCKAAIESGEYEAVKDFNDHSRDILGELIFQFSGKDDVSTALREISIFVNKLITEGQVKRDISIFDNCISILTPLLEGFKELEVKDKPKAVTGITYGKGNLEEYTIEENRSFRG
ncbi:MAG: flagellar protein FliS [Tissierellia bacterium]|nr:flagellar protein FliS [Tissierellia bacterium]